MSDECGVNGWRDICSSPKWATNASGEILGISDPKINMHVELREHMVADFIQLLYSVWPKSTARAVLDLVDAQVLSREALEESNGPTQ